MNDLLQAHQGLRNVLLNGRIVLNGLPLTAIEINGLVQGLELLFAKAKEVKPPQVPVEVSKDKSEEGKK